MLLGNLLKSVGKNYRNISANGIETDLTFTIKLDDLNKTKNIINKAPSAELKPDQFDNDSLPDYEILDKIIEKYIEQKESIQEILNSSEITSIISEEKIIEILGMIDRNEYKRRQSPPGIKITSLAFGRDRRYPISSDYKFSYKNYSSS